MDSRHKWSVLVVLVAAFVLNISGGRANANGLGVTSEAVDKIELGMSLDQVNAIVGQDGKLYHKGNVAGQDYATYEWWKGNAHISVTITDGKVTKKSFTAGD